MLASSLFGLTQRDLLSQNVAEWVNHELAKLSTDDLRQVEIEVKLGTIAEKKSLNRVSLPVTTECVLDPTHKDPFVCFNASVSNAYFTQTLSFLDKLIETKKKNNDSDKLETLPVQHDLDLFYDSPIDSNKIRVSLDQNNNFIEGIVKRTLASIEVYSPGDLVDFRISINLETPVAAELLQELQMSQAVPRFQREKTRLTYLQSVLKIDLTGVKMPMQQKKPIMVNGKLNKKEDESKKEIEIELNPKVVFECFQKDQENTARDDSKPKSMEILFGYLLNTTRLIIRNFSRPKDDA